MTTRKVTSIEKGFTNSALRVPYALAKLECGHAASVEMRGNILECMKCAHTYECINHAAKCPECGCLSAMVKQDRNAHNDSDLLTKVGDCVECRECVSYAKEFEKLRSVNVGEVSHARFRHNDSRGFGPGRYYLYKRDRTSPTGVALLFSVTDTQEVREILQAMKICSLSPTERY